jgi:hypothetical protein
MAMPSLASLADAMRRGEVPQQAQPQPLVHQHLQLRPVLPPPPPPAHAAAAPAPLSPTAAADRAQIDAVLRLLAQQQ